MELRRGRKFNFFLGFQVNDVGIHHKVKKIQEKVIERTPSLHPALVDIRTLHVTLAVTHLANQEDIKTIKKNLEDWSDKNKVQFFSEPMILNFTGIKTFNNSVAYIDINQCENYKKLHNLAQDMNELLESAGFSCDKKSSILHLTILKLSKDFKLLKSKKNFKSDFEELKQCKDHFGSQEVSHIQLLSMDDPKDENGYYKCHHQIDLPNKNK